MPVARAVGLIGVDVTKRDDVVAKLQSVPDVPLNLAAHTDETDVEFFVRPENRAGEDGRCDRGGREKSPAFHDLS